MKPLRTAVGHGARATPPPCVAAFEASRERCLGPRPADPRLDLVREYDPPVDAAFLTLNDQKWVHGRTYNASRERVNTAFSAIKSYDSLSRTR